MTVEDLRKTLEGIPGGAHLGIRFLNSGSYQVGKVEYQEGKTHLPTKGGIFEGVLEGEGGVDLLVFEIK